MSCLRFQVIKRGGEEMLSELSTKPKQDAIMSEWKGGGVKVTCYVQTYNHVDYIDEALESIVSQKTNFPFKVVVYDDCSTDGTQEKVRKYQEKYPNIVFPYLAEFNHGKEKVPRTEHEDLIEGDYVTICDGDDYWIDHYKLQKQYDLMVNSEQCLCIHPAVISFEGTNAQDLFCYYGDKLAIIDQEVVFNIKNQFAPTSSYFMSKLKYLEFLKFLRKKLPGYGDFFMEAISSDKGVLYIPLPMSVYRRGVGNSSTTLQNKSGLKEHQKNLENNLGNLKVLEAMCPYLSNKISTRMKLVEVDFLLNALNTNDTGINLKKELKQKLNEYIHTLGRFYPEKYIRSI